MTKITLGGTPVTTIGEIPKNGTKAPDFQLTATDLSIKSLSDFHGSTLLLNIFPSVDTGTCASSVRSFNKSASTIKNTKVLCISRDLPFAQNRFCGAEGLDNVIMLSDFSNGDFGKTYGIEIQDGPMANLHSRAVIIINSDGKISYSEQVPEIANEPDYEKALAAIQ